MKLFLCGLLVAILCVGTGQAWFTSWGRGRGRYTARVGGVPGVTRRWSVGVGGSWSFSNTHCALVNQKIVTRSQWGADVLKGQALLLAVYPVNNIYLYETGPCKEGQDERDCVKALQAHDQGTGKADIRYNFLVGQDGTVYEGRGWEHQGEHTPGMNDKSLGVGFIGSFNKKEPSDDSQYAINRLMICGKKVEKSVSSSASLNNGEGLGKAFRAMLEQCNGLRVFGNSCD